MLDLDAIRAKFFEPTQVDMPLNGMYKPSANEIAFAANGVKVGSFVGGSDGASPRLVHTGQTPVKASTDGTDHTIVATETQIVEISINQAMLVTGVAVFNGSAVAGNLKVGLFSSAGALLAQSASTAASGTDAFQRIAFTAAYQAAPGRYYVGVQGNNTGGKINSHPIGNFGASVKTGETYGTFTTITPPTTFTADVGPMGGLY